MDEISFLLSLQDRLSRRINKIKESKVHEHEQFTTHDVNNFISAIRNYNFRDYLIAKLIIKSGLRISDVLSVPTENIDNKTANIHISTVKGHRIVELGDECLRELEEYLNGRTTGLLFITREGNPVTRGRLNFAFTDCCNKARVKHFSPEALRYMSNRCQFNAIK